MSTTGPALIPQAFWFRLAIPCRRLDDLPRAGQRGRLLNLPASCALPAAARLEGREPFADVRAAWNPRGLALSIQVQGKKGPIQRDPADPNFIDGVHLGIDTRDTRDVHRATRFCHRFSAIFTPEKGPSASLDVTQKTIHRAMADAPKARPESILSRAEIRRDGWLVELFFKAESLNGYDPENNRRLGLMVHVVEPSQGDQFLTVGREFPIDQDPSLWATLELRDEGPEHGA
jgi:hypothetical protein